MIKFEPSKYPPATKDENRFHRVMDAVDEKKKERASTSSDSNKLPGQVAKDNVSKSLAKRNAR